MRELDFNVKVFLNREEDEQGRLAIFSRGFGEDRYRSGDKLEKVVDFTVTDTTVDGVLNKTFAMTNRGSGTFVGDDVYPQRSLSVGDVVEVEGVRYSVEGVGFKEVSS